MNRESRITFTDAWLRGVACSTRTDFYDAEQPGLMCRVTPNGQKSFVVRYRVNGERKSLLLGLFPELKLKDARDRARKARVAIGEGRDPSAEKQATKKAVAKNTVAELADEYNRVRGEEKKRSPEDARMLKVDVVPHWGERAVKSITRTDVRTLADIVKKRGSAVMANRVLGLLSRFLNFAVDHEWIDANPAARIKQTKEETRERVLTDDELVRIWRVLGRFPTTAEKRAPGRKESVGTKADPICPISKVLADVQKARILTAQRGGEVIKMKWRDLELKNPNNAWWTIPGSDTKNGKPHRVPLTRLAVELIQSQKHTGPLVFCGTGESLKDRAKKAPSRIAKRLGIDDFRGHDLRRTVASHMARLGVPVGDISKVLNHTVRETGEAAVTEIYVRYRFDKEKRAAMEAWEKALLEILPSELVAAA